MDTFDVIFTTYSPFVFRYLRSLCGDAAVAEELTAETFTAPTPILIRFAATASLRRGCAPLRRTHTSRTPAQRAHGRRGRA